MTTASAAHDAGDGGDVRLVDASYDAYVLTPGWAGQRPVLFGASDDATSLAVDDGHVYWQTPAGSVFACPLGGCPSGGATLLASLVGSSGVELQSLSAESGVATFISASGAAVSSVPFASPDVVRTVYSDSFSSVRALATDAASVYFSSNVSSDGGAVEIGLYVCPLTGSCPSPKTLYKSSSTNGIGPLFVEGGQAYFVDDDYSNNGPAVRAVSTGGGTPRTVCTSTVLRAGNVPSIAVASGYVFFTSSASPADIYSCDAKATSAPTVYVEDYAPYALATDGTNLYWSNYVPTTGTIATCTAASRCASPLTVASQQDAPFAIAATTSGVYWTTRKSVYGAQR